ncbi:gamma-glutamyl kinase [Candidatus Symbiothrix dinenymphae]|nr:gamma-glutamyl kinase [Candidatus Symbiothrix dinenymphae]
MTKKIIIKIGSSSLLNEQGIDDLKIEQLFREISGLMQAGVEVLLVTSGAIALGCHKLRLAEKPKSMALKQACASIGQVGLMNKYEIEAEKVGLNIGQILVNHDDFVNKKRMLNLSNTLQALLEKKVLPVINENDALMVEEIRVGDNDTLSSFFVPMLDAQLLIIVSDIDGLYDKNPKEYPDAKLVETVVEINDDIRNMTGTKISAVGTGGMQTKLQAAEIVMRAGGNMVIINSNHLEGITQAVRGEKVGTLFIGKKK